MAKITDYNSLAAQIINYLDNTSPVTVATVDQFICVAEKNVYRDLRVPTMEAMASFTIGGDTRFIQVPHNYLETRSVSILSQNANIRPVAYTEYVRKWSATAGTPSVYARHANQFLFDNTPAEDTEITMVYYRSFEDLAPDNDTGSEDPRPFLSVTSDAWLYAALAEAATFIGDDRFAYFMQRYDGAIAMLNKSAAELELSGSPLQVSISSDDWYGNGVASYGGYV